ncbi:Ig-like domain-containing protein [Undibacterium aquatile]|uniref:Tandem-95 repeat protein n=1 Tax=Undibacterium aquatile TaxID=1537398 RepID=A0ABR6XJB6_9BURK|nr:Ig-like domain-containing protein [Undibacterium aquatile]MBC3813009.1 tandem-95 repeat protein [Undibacterium aquatile]
MRFFYANSTQCFDQATGHHLSPARAHGFVSITTSLVMSARYTQPKLSLLFLALLAQLNQASAQQSTDPGIQNGGNLQFIGENSRIGIGYQNGGAFMGELFGVLSDSGTNVWLGEVWLSNKSGGGKLSYHSQQQNSVVKYFAAIDQNEQKDKKLSIGIGQENQDWFGHVYASYSPGNKRLLQNTLTTTITEQNGNDAGRGYIDTITTTTNTRLYERAYDYGVGARAGHYYTENAVRVSAGLDYEWGKASSKQFGVSFTAEKFFVGTPHSLALQVGQYRKSGDFDSQQNDRRINLMYRYSFGGTSSRFEQKYRMVEVPAAPTAPTIIPARTEQRLVKTTTTMTGDAFFKIDSAGLTDFAKQELAKIAETLKKYPHEGNVRITGHTCDIGSVSYNQKLSLSRAVAVRDYLISLGVVNTEEVVVEGKGKLEPKYPATKETREKNRRVDLEFVSRIDKTEVIEIPEQVLPAPAAEVTYKREDISQEPAWIRRALRNSVEHKRTVDTYRYQEKTQTETKTRNYLNRAPQAASDSASTQQNQSVVIDVLSNDADPDSDAITISTVGNAAHGTATIQSQKILYVPHPDYSGNDSFTYTINDGRGGQSTAQVNVSVAAANKAPVANDDTFTVPGSSDIVLDLLANDRDPDGDPLTISAITALSGNNGSVRISGNKVIFTPGSNSLPGSFQYTISDGRGGKASAQVTLNVIAPPVNNAPIARNDSFIVPGTTETTIDPLANDSDPDGDPLTLVSVTPMAGNTGTLRISGNKVIFSPFGSFIRDSFQYTISDGKGKTATATVTLVDP